MAEKFSLPESTDRAAPLDERLERGEMIWFPCCPFPLPQGEDRLFLYEQEQSKIHKNISLNPHSGRLAGLRVQSAERMEKLRALLQAFGEEATRWLAELLPRYAPYWERDRITFRPEEEATRPLRLNARNDLLHIDNFPTRRSHGARILRLYVNINLTDPRVWVTSETFPRLFERYVNDMGLPGTGESWRSVVAQNVIRLVNRRWRRRSEYDRFMQRLHQYLKSNDDFQERCRKRYWKFPPNSAWLLFADSLSHAVLRGRFALEHSYFVPRCCLALPEEAPAAIFEQACLSSTSRQAA